MTHPLDALVKRAAPITDEQLRRCDLSGGEAELRAALLRAAAPSPRAARIVRAHRRAGRRPIGAAALGSALALVAALAGVTLTRDGDVATGPDRAWAAAAVRVAHAVPRILIDQPGWRVERADEFTVGQGEMTFANRALAVDLAWRRLARDERFHVRDDPAASRLPDVRVLGNRAAVLRFDAPHGYGYETVLWRSGRYALTLRVDSLANRGPLPRERLLMLLAGLRSVSVDAWLSAMPASVVQPADQRTAVERMLVGVPVPDGLDVAAKVHGDTVRDRYQLQGAVVGTVACAWIERWVAARRSGDADAAARAVAAMGSWRDWPVLRAMAPKGGYPSVVREYAEALAGDGRILAGKPLTVAESYRDTFGCRR